MDIIEQIEITVKTYLRVKNNKGIEFKNSEKAMIKNGIKTIIIGVSKNTIQNIIKIYSNKQDICNVSYETQLPHELVEVILTKFGELK